MYQEVSNLLIFSNIKRDSILYKMSDIFKDFSTKDYDKSELTNRIYNEIRRLLEISTDFGFDENLWHNYITYLLISTETPFSVTCEKVGANEGSVNILAKSDFENFYKIFNYDFSEIEEKLSIKVFDIISNYKAVKKSTLVYNANVSEKVRNLSRQLETAKSGEDFFKFVTEFYKAFGVGMYGLNKAFRIKDTNDEVSLIPINNMDTVVLDDLVGYDIQKKKLIENTEAFVKGRKANNCLLYGDSGTGKSTSIKAIVNMYYNEGLRMIEIYKHQFKDLSSVIAMIKNRNYKFIIYMDDLSFEEFEIEYKFLKAVIEGGVETRPDNILIYATSNRRHIIKETWKDRNDVEIDNGIHKSDNMEEKLSLVNRFGCQIYFGKPAKKEFQDIVIELAKKNDIKLELDELLLEANKWEIAHGGFSGRTAQQFINHCLSIAKQGGISLLSYIKGELAEVFEDTIVVENNGMGINVKVPATVLSNIPSIGEDIKVYTYLYVREDAINVYGFLTRDDLNVFKLLLNVNGVGPKAALGILSTISANDLRYAVLSDDVNAIKKAPGIGAKTAQRLIIELKDKLKLESEEALILNANVGTKPSDDLILKNDAIEALVSLGYSQREAMDAVKKVDISGKNLDDIIKESLKNLAFL